MILTFIAPGARTPVGGVTMIYEYASAMARRGHQVRLFHYRIFQQHVSRLEDIEWSDFDPGIEHVFPRWFDWDPNDAPPSDVIFGYSSEEKMPRHLGLPVAFVQGYQMLRPHIEEATFHAPCPKICVAKWLVEVGVRLGVPRVQLAHVPLGLHHERFRLTRPVEGRGPRVSFCYNPHPQKRPDLALRVLAAVRERVPDLDAVLFSGGAAGDDVPEWIDFRVNPRRDELVDDIYNRSSAFLCTSDVEGFGLPSIEAMAGGAALVTTDNGGADDYALPGTTALVAPVGDAEALVGHLVDVLTDDARRVALAETGRRYVERFDWAHTAEQLEQFLERYRADPVAYGRPAASSAP